MLRGEVFDLSRCAWAGFYLLGAAVVLKRRLCPQETRAGTLRIDLEQRRPSQEGTGGGDGQFLFEKYVPGRLLLGRSPSQKGLGATGGDPEEEVAVWRRGWPPCVSPSPVGPARRPSWAPALGGLPAAVPQPFPSGPRVLETAAPGPGSGARWTVPCWPTWVPSVRWRLRLGGPAPALLLQRPHRGEA